MPILQGFKPLQMSIEYPPEDAECCVHIVYSRST